MRAFYKNTYGALYCGNSAEILKHLASESIDLVVTSPPYDNRFTYDNKMCFNLKVFKIIAKELARILKKGGVIVWVVNDMVEDGSETLTSFKHALFFKEKCNLKIHDTMIFAKSGFRYPSKNRYHSCFEYMFVISKGSPKTFNPIMDRANLDRRGVQYHTYRDETGKIVKRIKRKCEPKEFGKRYNIWKYSVGFNHTYKSKDINKHPAPFPVELAQDHIISWSNKGDLVLDPFAGSGTTLYAAQSLGRSWIGIEINEDYCKLIQSRLLRNICTYSSL